MVMQIRLDDYLNNIKPYLRNIIIGLHNSGTWKIQLKIAINFSEEEPVMHSSSNNIKLTPYSDANDVIEKLLKSLHSQYQDNLETSIKGCGFIFDSVQLMYNQCHK